MTSQSSSDNKSLSNDALYAPLSTYDGGTSTASNSSSKERSHHSLTLQTSASLRESSLLSFLSNTCQSLKASHLYESIVYRSICGSITKYGTGDNDNSNQMTKSFFENKLSNRSLVLVGGGVHSHASKEDDGVVTSMIQSAATAVSGKKRERKRVGGNGMFGSLSKRKRKKILKRNAVRKLQEKSFAEPIKEIVNEVGQTEMISTDTQSLAGDDNKVIESIHKMWIEYIAKLLLHVKPMAKSTESNKLSTSMTPQIHQQITTLILEAEHVGMAATIAQCPSRRHLTEQRCVVVNETLNTWSMAINIIQRRKGKEQTLSSNNETATNGPDAKSMSREWKIVVVPKHKTVLEVNVPLSCSHASSVTIRLET